MDLKLEKKLWRKGYDTVIGIDEVGRGCLAGPMYLCAAILRKQDERKLRMIRGVNDSKQLSSKKRAEIFECVEELNIPYLIFKASPKLIDRHNIYRAALLGCDALLRKYSSQNEGTFFTVFDGGLRAALFEKEHQGTYIKGDQNIFSIALASVIAKHLRDTHMIELTKKFPDYGWERNKGYGTEFHRGAIAQYGTSPLHRLTFLRNVI